MYSTDNFCLHGIFVINQIWFSAHYVSLHDLDFNVKKSPSGLKPSVLLVHPFPFKETRLQLQNGAEAAGCKESWKMKFLRRLSFSSINLRQDIASISKGQVYDVSLENVYKTTREKSSL